MAIEYGPNFGKCGQHARWQFDGLNCITISGNGCVDRFENDVDYNRRIMRDPHDLGPWYEKPSFSESLIPKRVSRIVIQEGITQLTEMAFWSFLDLVQIDIPSSVQFISIDAFLHPERINFLVRSGSYAESIINENQWMKQ